MTLTSEQFRLYQRQNASESINTYIAGILIVTVCKAGGIVENWVYNGPTDADVRTATYTLSRPD